jgi:hypothetical protein
MQNTKASFFILCLIMSVIFIVPQTAFAGIVPCGDEGDPCTLCHLIVGIHNIVDFFKNILLTAAITGIVIAGVIYTISSGDPKMTGQAKNLLSASLIGFAVVLAAWLIVNVTMLLMSTKSDLGIGAVNWYTFTCNTTSSTGGGGGSGGNGGSGGSGTPNQTGECNPTGNGCGGFSGNGCNYTSPKLAQVLKCVNDNKNSKGLPNISITSITLNAHSDWCQKCVWNYVSKDYCAHTQNSCHFGGRNCKGTSQGADLGGYSGSQLTQVAQLARECGAEYTLANAPGHYSHAHISVNNSQCGCH